MGNVTFCDQYKNLHNIIIMRDKLKILLDYYFRLRYA